MAQWAGYGSGRSHATKVKSLEEALAVAVAALNSSIEVEASSKSKAVHSIAKRLLSARLHLVRSQISKARETQNSADLETLLKQEEKIRMGGIEAIISTYDIAGRSSWR